MFGGAKNTWPLDWNGQVGYIYYLTEYEDANVILPGKSLMIPNDESELDQFEETLVALLELKNAVVIYNSQLQKEPILEEESYQNYYILNMLKRLHIVQMLNVATIRFISVSMPNQIAVNRSCTERLIFFLFDFCSSQSPDWAPEKTVKNLRSGMNNTKEFRDEFNDSIDRLVGSMCDSPTLS
ncbi:hypothetical protein A0J61_02042 [Choanephora cucurbitarum]|uniref:Uncharacterized protein n=1 Tax=Choanephora cucurbitarum TaxID=101091 RepID=A0A1C7NLN7_9FUNG|nr:hypothetical protein A0J61_02042 [Choanephora cucurbitarum]